jgi:Protein of unknown function (DUF4199)
MKKIVLTFGLISGAIVSVLMLTTMSFIDRIGFDKALILGYTSIVLAFLLVFFGVRSYRENVGGGQISFGRAFSVGILITLISCICYVVTWEIAYFTFLSDFGEKYSNYMIDSARSSGASAQEIATQVEEMKDVRAILDNPLYNAAFSFLEPFPVGLLVTLISALILRKRPREVPENERLVSTS